MPIIDHFGLLAPLYETFILPKDPEELCTLADLPTSGALLDAGGGTGRVAQFMLEKAGHVVVADLSCKMLAEASQKEGLQPVCSPTETLPFPDHSFQRIIMVDTLHHVVDQQMTINELWRLLAPGGIIVIEEPNIHAFSVKLIAIAEKLALMRSHFLSLPQITAHFDFSDACLEIQENKSTVYIIAKKQISAG
ncbi:MAG: class I SAM-dependent methyltransferase [Anaerolineaceae bacterium]|nr:class I SAM-dependent methyltransferase [Anaerolineaceae bacterium]